MKALLLGIAAGVSLVLGCATATNQAARRGGQTAASDSVTADEWVQIEAEVEYVGFRARPGGQRGDALPPVVQIVLLRVKKSTVPGPARILFGIEPDDNAVDQWTRGRCVEFRIRRKNFLAAAAGKDDDAGDYMMYVGAIADFRECGGHQNPTRQP